MTELMQASRQWASRPADERFISLLDMQAQTRLYRQRSASRIVSTRKLEARPVEGDRRGVQLVGPTGNPSNPTHWAFTQLAARAKAPSDYLRTLPAPLVADCINVGLLQQPVADTGILLRSDGRGGTPSLMAVTGPNYGRIYNSTIVDALVDRFGDGVNGDFRVPGEFGKRVPVTQANTTLYASDRDMFVFLADEERRITVPNRRGGQSGEMARGFFVWNSEVGSQTFGIATFLFDYVCCNRIVWGAEGYTEKRIRHTSSAPDRWIEEVAPALIAYSRSSTQPAMDAIQTAMQRRLDNVDEYLARRFTKSQATAIKLAHVADEARPIETVWDVVTGATAYAREMVNQDSRVDIERKAGALLAA